MPDRQLAFVGSEAASVSLVGPDIQLQQEAFTWLVKEDIWGGVIDSSARQNLSQRLQSEFEPVLPPSQRTMEQFNTLLMDIAQILGKVEWSDSGQQLEEDGDNPVRLNALLSFYLQASWIYEIFKDSPGASVAIR